MDHLALQVGKRHRVVVDDPKRADAGGSQILQDRGTESSCPDHQNPRILELLLPAAADFPHDDVAGVTFKFGWGKHFRSWSN